MGLSFATVLKHKYDMFIYVYNVDETLIALDQGRRGTKINKLAEGGHKSLAQKGPAHKGPKVNKSNFLMCPPSTTSLLSANRDTASESLAHI